MIKPLNIKSARNFGDYLNLGMSKPINTTTFSQSLINSGLQPASPRRPSHHPLLSAPCPAEANNQYDDTCYI